jgi:hypothetical protein
MPCCLVDVYKHSGECGASVFRYKSKLSIERSMAVGTETARIGAPSGPVGVRGRNRESEILKRAVLPESRDRKCKGIMVQ